MAFVPCQFSPAEEKGFTREAGGNTCKSSGLFLALLKEVRRDHSPDVFSLSYEYSGERKGSKSEGEGPAVEVVWVFEQEEGVFLFVDLR